MPLLIPITGVDASYRVPGGYAEILFAQGPASAAAGVRQVVFVMPKTSVGSWTVNTLYRVNSAGEAEVGGGPGSPVHRAIRKFLRRNKDAKVHAVVYNATSAGSPIAATGTITFTTNASATGTATVTVCGEDASYTFNAGATPTTIAAAVAAAINDKTWLPVTATPAVGVVTLTAKIAGISQGTATVGVIRYRAAITAGVGTTVATSGGHLGSAAAGVEGSTTEAANLATALATLDAVRKYYIVTSVNDATSLGNVKTHLVTKCDPRRGLRSVAISAFTAGLAAVTTIATTLNYERMAIAWQLNSEHDCAEIAGAWAADRQKREQTDSAWNFDSTRLNPDILPAFATTDWPNGSDQNDAINDGITVIASDDRGAYVVMSVDTRSKNAAGTQDDFRATETHRVSVADEFTDELLSLWGNQYQGQKLKDDQRLADTTVNPNQKLIRGVLTPSQLVAPIRSQMDVYERTGKLQNTESTKQSVQVVKSGSRLECGLEINVIDHAHQATFRIAEISQG